MNRAVGIAAILIGIAGLFLVQQNAATRASGGRDISPLLWLALPLIVVGALAVFYHWASLLMACVFFLLGAAVLIGSLISVPFPWNILDVLIGLAMMYPLIAIKLNKT